MLPLAGTVTKGNISRRWASSSANYLQITTAVSPGNSGGPLVSTKGEAIGVVTFRIEQLQNTNFAVDVRHVKELLEGKTRKSDVAASAQDPHGASDRSPREQQEDDQPVVQRPEGPAWALQEGPDAIHMQDGTVVSGNVVREEEEHYVIELRYGARIRLHQGWVRFVRKLKEKSDTDVAEKNASTDDRKVAGDFLASDSKRWSNEDTAPAILSLRKGEPFEPSDQGRRVRGNETLDGTGNSTTGNASAGLDVIQGGTAFVDDVILPFKKAISRKAFHSLSVRLVKPDGFDLQLLSARADPISASLGVHTAWDMTPGFHILELEAFLYRDGRAIEDISVKLPLQVRRREPSEIDQQLYRLYQVAQAARTRRVEAERQLISLADKVDELHKLAQILRRSLRTRSSESQTSNIPLPFGGTFTFSTRRRGSVGLSDAARASAEDRYRKLAPEVEAGLQKWSSEANVSLRLEMAALSSLTLARDTLDTLNTDRRAIARGILQLLADLGDTAQSIEK